MRRIVSIESEKGGFLVEVFDQKQEAENNKRSKGREYVTYKDPYKRYVFKNSEVSNMVKFVEKAIELYKPEKEVSTEFDKAFEEFSKEEADD